MCSMYLEDHGLETRDGRGQSPPCALPAYIPHLASALTPSPDKLIIPALLSSVHTAGVSGSEQPLCPLQAQRAMTTSPAQWATTVLRGHHSPGPVQQGPLEGRVE